MQFVKEKVLLLMGLYIILYATCSLPAQQQIRYSCLTIKSCMFSIEPTSPFRPCCRTPFTKPPSFHPHFLKDNFTRLNFPTSKIITKLMTKKQELRGGDGFANFLLIKGGLGVLKSEDANNYNQFYQIRMLSQYYLIVDANGLSVRAADHSAPQDGRRFLEEIQKALSLSLNLYALAQQESKVRALSESHPVSLLPSADPSARLNMPIEENNPIPHLYKNVSERKYSSVTGDYFCKTNADSPKASALSDLNGPDKSQQWLEEGFAEVAERKIKIKKVSSGSRNRKRFRMTLKGARIGERSGRGCLRGVVKLLLGSAVPEGHLGVAQLLGKREELMDRWVRSWNPDKEQSYIKNREFRMLLRN